MFVCRSIGYFLTAPFLAFDRMTGGEAAAFGTDKQVWDQVQAYNDKPHQLLNNLMGVFRKSFIKGINFPHKDFSIGWSRVCGSKFYSDTELLPFEFAMQSNREGFNQSFWTMFESIAETQQGPGWFHELYLDIMSEDKLNEWVKIMSGGNNEEAPADSSLTTQAFKTQTGISFYLNLFLRPNPFPVLQTSNPSQFYMQQGSLGPLVGTLANSTVTLDKTRYDALKASTNFFHDLTGTDFTYQLNQSAMDIRTVFLLYSQNVQPTYAWSYQLPTFYDIVMYAKCGYNPLNIMTKYIRANSRENIVNGGVCEPVDKVDTLATLTQLLLRLTGNNIMMDVYRSGSGVVEISPEISIGEIISMKGLHQGQEALDAYVTKVKHSFIPGGKSFTTMQFSRVMSKTVYDSLFETMQSRIGYASTVSFRDVISQWKLSDVIPEMVAP